MEVVKRKGLWPWLYRNSNFLRIVVGRNITIAEHGHVEGNGEAARGLTAPDHERKF